ncbi:MAG: VWA domain-containing protein [Microthrixaceae bacterium]
MGTQRDHEERHPERAALPDLPAPNQPFAAIAGQAELKLALLLAGVQPYLGGVLITGEPGTTPAVTARAFAAMLPPGAPFIEVPRSADVDRLVGISPQHNGSTSGLLTRVDGGVLFLDAIDQFPAELVEVILDAHYLGYNRVERDGRSETHASRFVLVATSDGPIRPRWAAHFGLSVDAMGLHRAEHRVEAARRQLHFEADPTSFLAEWEPRQRDLRRRLDLARPADVPDQLLTPIGWLTAEVGVVGLAGDVALARGAAALAGWEGRRVATESDLAAVAPMVLRHQAVHGRPDGPDAGDLAQAIGRFTSSGGSLEATIGSPDKPEAPRWVRDDAPERASSADDAGSSTPADPSPATSTDNAVVSGSAGDRAATWSEGDSALFSRAPWGGATPTEPGLTDDREPPSLASAGRSATDLVVLCVDASSSTGSEDRVLAASGALLRTLAAAPNHAMEVALVTFGGDTAHVVLSPTSSMKVARSKLVEVTVGGGSPLATGIQTALSVATLHSAGRPDGRSLLVLVTDGRADVALPPEDTPFARQTATSVAEEAGEVDEVDGAGAAGASGGPDDEPAATSEPEPAAQEAPTPDESTSSPTTVVREEDATDAATDFDLDGAASPFAQAQAVAERVARRSVEAVLVYTGDDENLQPMRNLSLRMGATFLTLPELSAQSLAAALRNLTAAVDPEPSPDADEAAGADEAEANSEATHPPTDAHADRAPAGV